MDILRVFTGSDGRSHLEDFTVALEDHGAWGEISNVWPANGVQFRTVPRNYFLDFHTAPRRQLVVTLSGSVELEMGDGNRRILGPGTIVLAEDTAGQGHVSRSVDHQPRTCLFVHLDGDLPTPQRRAVP
jgi:hypothetical protein